MVPDAAAAKLAVDLAVHSLVGGVHGRLLQASRPAAAAIYSGAPVDASAPNLIVVLGESVALSRMELYGYERQTTPRLAALREARPADWVQMERAVSNATATKVALPAMLTGLFPSRTPVEQHTFPLLWHYAHAAGYQTALISAQSYAWNNLEGFFVDDALDHVFTLERSNAEIVNSEGMDDRRMMAETLGNYRPLCRTRPVCGGPAIQLHALSGLRAAGLELRSKPWPDASYDNAVAYMDHLLGRLFDHLAAQGLAANTMVLFVADHGEDLDGVHKLHRTDSYYQTAIAVPFFAVVPERQRQRLGVGWDQWRENAQMRVALTDLVPTALDLLGLSADSTVAAWQERLDGRSLLRPLDPDRSDRGGQHGRTRAVVAQRLCGRGRRLEVHQLQLARLHVVRLGDRRAGTARFVGRGRVCAEPGRAAASAPRARLGRRNARAGRHPRGVLKFAALHSRYICRPPRIPPWDAES